MTHCTCVDTIFEKLLPEALKPAKMAVFVEISAFFTGSCRIFCKIKTVVRQSAEWHSVPRNDILSLKQPTPPKNYFRTSNAQKSISKFSKNDPFVPKTMLKYCCKISGVCTTFQAKKNFPESCSVSLYYHFTMFWHQFKSWKCLKDNGSTFIVSARSWTFELCAQICRNRPFSST